VEWVEVTGRTIEEAKEAALEQLGVAEGDAEVVVVAEPRTGLFGRMRGEARVRARVRPVGPRPKRVRRPRERQRSGSSGRSSNRNGRSSTPRASSDGAPSTEAVGGDRNDKGGSGGSGRSARRRRSRQRARTVPGAATAAGVAEGRASEHAGSGGAERRDEEVGMAEGMTLQEQADVAKQFLEGLLVELDLQATVTTREIDEETVEIAANGDDLGLLVGPRGSTLAALQDLTRTVVQRHFPSRTDRILIDVAGYRERRVAALRRFSTQIAGEVIESGAERALEPMSPADRKVVHDAVNEIDGVGTRSEGEDPARYIVIAPSA